jgi:hypothetical protein
MNVREREAKVFRGMGLHPIAFYPHSKTPAFAEGEIIPFRTRKPTDAELRDMFSDPQRNIGLITGPGHLAVLDVDGDEGTQSLQRLPELPDTPTVLTQRGFHKYFWADEPIATRIKVLPGLDLLGNDWQVLAPSSIHLNQMHTYTWAPGKRLTDLDRAKLPAYFYDIAQPSHPLASTLPDTADCIGNLGASNQKSRLLALSGRLLAPRFTPTTLDTYGGWPEILTYSEVNLQCARYLGLLSVDVGRRFPCVLPGHSDTRTSARLYWNVKSPVASMTLKYCDNHYESGEFWYSLADVFASRNYGEAVRLKGPETTVWQLRLFIAAGVLLPYPVVARILPPDVPRHVKQAYDGFLDLLRAKWLHTPGDPTPFTWTFAAAWCGMRSAGYVVGAIKWLLKEGYLRQVGTHRPTKGRKMMLFLPGV